MIRAKALVWKQIGLSLIQERVVEDQPKENG